MLVTTRESSTTLTVDMYAVSTSLNHFDRGLVVEGGAGVRGIFQTSC
jgi:hypothetical protein